MAKKKKSSQKENNKRATRTRYSEKELEEFKELIEQKLESARQELKYYQDEIMHLDNQKTDDTIASFKSIDDSSVHQEKEFMNKMAERQRQYISHLEKALIRIKNGTYGVCRVTGKLISKERLKLVPHATLSIEAKKNRRHPDD